MQITPDEVMEILADDQMKHAEAPSDDEIEGMFHQTEAHHFDDWNTERNFYDMHAEKRLHPPARHKFTNIGKLERKHEALAEIERENVETSRNN